MTFVSQTKESKEWRDRQLLAIIVEQAITVKSYRGFVYRIFRWVHAIRTDRKNFWNVPRDIYDQVNMVERATPVTMFASIDDATLSERLLLRVSDYLKGADSLTNGKEDL